MQASTRPDALTHVAHRFFVSFTLNSPNLPPNPEGAYKKAYYPYPDTVYFLDDESASEWRRGVISNNTKSTSLHLVVGSAAFRSRRMANQYIVQVVDEDTQETFQILVQYIRKRADWD